MLGQEDLDNIPLLGHIHPLLPAANTHLVHQGLVDLHHQVAILDILEALHQAVQLDIHLVIQVLVDLHHRAILDPVLEGIQVDLLGDLAWHNLPLEDHHLLPHHNIHQVVHNRLAKSKLNLIIDLFLK